MKAIVSVSFKPSVFDPQGSALAQTLKRIGFAAVQDARIGKKIEIDLGSIAPEEAKRQVEKMCATILTNPVIESYTYELVG